jgi:uncharacterized protein YjbI with pentapeptide repeats
MMRWLFVPPLALAALLAPAGAPLLAGCADVAAPGVYWRRCVLDREELASVDLSGATIRDASFKRADLSDALLVGADARRAKFVTTNMQRVDLSGANLVRADMTQADLTGAVLRDADLTLTRLFQTDFSNADLTGVRLDGADMLQTRFDGATWIDGVTICAEESIGRCHRSKAAPEPETGPDATSGELGEPEPSG